MCKGKSIRTWAVLVCLALVASGCTAYIDYHRIHVLNAQETAWHEDNDELRLATISFRTTPGVLGSTEVIFNEDSVQRVASDLDDGDIRIISNARGLYTFENLDVVTLSELLAGDVPQIFGQLVIGIEDDGTPVGAISNILRDIRDELQVQLQQIIETMTISDILADPDGLAERFSEAAVAIKEAATPGFWEAIGLVLGSFFNPDDFLSFNFLFFVPVGPQLAPIVDAAFGDLPANIFGGALPTVAIGGAIPPKVFDLDFQDHETHYRVRTYVGAGDQGISPPSPTTTQPPFNPCFPDPPPPPGGHCA